MARVFGTFHWTLLLLHYISCFGHVEQSCNAHHELFEWHISPSREALGKRVADYVMAAAIEAIADHGFFSVAFSGGSLPKILAQGLERRKSKQNGSIMDDQLASPQIFANWRVVLADERVVNEDHPDSNLGLCRSTIFGPNGNGAHLLGLSQSLLEAGQTTDALALDYERRLKSFLEYRDQANASLPQLDMVLLGMGGDGHTCSLFPDHSLLQEEARLVASVEDSPKPPSRRITLTLPMLNAARRVAFVVAGSSKASIVVQAIDALETGAEIVVATPPAARVRPHHSGGELRWFLDDTAAAALPKKPLTRAAEAE